jgi:sugar lactone lactonase YvrE
MEVSSFSVNDQGITYRAALGESPFLLPDKRFAYIDIVGQSLVISDATRILNVSKLQFTPTAISSYIDGVFVLVAADGIVFYNSITNTVEDYFKCRLLNINERFNDCMTLPDNTIYISSMDCDEKKSIGGLYKFNSGVFSTLLSNYFVVGNGLARIQDGCLCVESSKSIIYSYKLRNDATDVSEWLRFEPQSTPDGIRVINDILIITFHGAKEVWFMCIHTKRLIFKIETKNFIPTASVAFFEAGIWTLHVTTRLFKNVENSGYCLSYRITT